METVWRKCGSCKKDIGFNQVYQVCSVCKGKYAFCSVDCWDEHVPVMNHKNAWAEEERSPANTVATNNQPVRRIVSSPSSSPASGSTTMDAEILIVASKLKQYVKEKHDLNTSADVMEALSHAVRRLTDQAAGKAKAEGRKTLMGRDF
jgi:histone H3/H4